MMVWTSHEKNQKNQKAIKNRFFKQATQFSKLKKYPKNQINTNKTVSRRLIRNSKGLVVPILRPAPVIYNL